MQNPSVHHLAWRMKRWEASKFCYHFVRGLALSRPTASLRATVFFARTIRPVAAALLAEHRLSGMWPANEQRFRSAYVGCFSALGGLIVSGLSSERFRRDEWTTARTTRGRRLWTPKTADRDVPCSRSGTSLVCAPRLVSAVDLWMPDAQYTTGKNAPGNCRHITRVWID